MPVYETALVVFEIGNAYTKYAFFKVTQSIFCLLIVICVFFSGWVLQPMLILDL